MQGSAAARSLLSTLIRRAGVILVAIVLIAAASSFVVAAPNGKGHLAPDLVERLKRGSLVETVRLVVQPAAGADLGQVLDRVKSHGGNAKGVFTQVGLIAIDLPLGEVEAFGNEIGIDYVSPDRPVGGSGSHLENTTGASNVYPSGAFLSSGYDGKGVAVAVIDSGVDVDHADLRESGARRVVLSVDFTRSGSVDDPYGHGTHVAGIVAGNGYSGLQVGVNYAGIAPRGSIINLRALDDYGRGYISNVIAAIDYAISIKNSYNLRVINLSLSAPPLDSYKNDPLCQAAERAVKAGIVVVAAAGNFGTDPNGNKLYGSITSPGIDPAVITVGATDTRWTDQRSDDTIAPYSSRGPTMSHSTDPVTGAVAYDKLAKPDLVAPGARIVALERYQNYLVTQSPMLHIDVANSNIHGRYMRMYGTSMSTGVVSGAAALMLQANPSLTPNMVKAILMFTAQMMNGPDLFEQGAGMLNVDGAVRLSKRLRSDLFNLLPGQGLLTFLGLPNFDSTVAGENFVWSQGLIWDSGWLSGQALFTTMQQAYSGSLVWGRGSLYGSGVTYNGGLYSDNYVVFGQNNQWCYVVWDSGTTLISGLLYKNATSGSGLIWDSKVISSDFFTLNGASLIWTRYDSGLVWGLDSGLVWGLDSSLVWGSN